MSSVSFARLDTALGTDSSETNYKSRLESRLESRQTGDVFTIPSTKSFSGQEAEKPDVVQESKVWLDKNPFKIPSDIDIFLLRDQQREKAKAERERRKTLKVHEKMTCSTMQNAKHSGFKKEIQMEEEAEDKELAAEAERLKALRESISWKIAITKDQVVEKEPIHDYINQKRQMFLLQYAVTVKKDEIQKLENLAIEEEAKLEKAEEELERDAAIAEKETKAKLEKITEIRELTAQMMNIQSEIARFEDTLQEYVVFKDFLHQLSPKDWREDYEKRRIKEKERVVKITPAQDLREKNKRRAMSIAKHSSFDLSATDLSSSRTPSQIMARKDSIKMSRRSSRQTGRSSQSRKGSIPILPPDEKLTPELSDDDDDELAYCQCKQQDSAFSSLELSRWSKKDPATFQESCHLPEKLEPELYFTDPRQLLNLFTELEEQNLSLIQNSQETEETLDELRHTLANTRNKMINICTCLQDKMLVSLHRKVLEVYRRCIGENEANLGTLQMLTVIEHQLDDLLECLERVPPAKIEQAEKAKEKERRMRIREEKIRQQRLLQEERLQRALARAQADVKKKTGRRLVFRSEPPAFREKEDEDQGLIDREKEELLYYFT
ncbi:hypothetical protein JD844_012892 [Phrynosoma platyrhinos]|uniref:DUF4200 domain-containing protein n=1 Tax=Phrynosoma platyrhinos TaxID=52577 RepID=A0ABQ7TK44_PHRPL|nr:hypothetical protein JD844_012892 [Phrynosoma platyrhinos]